MIRNRCDPSRSPNNNNSDNASNVNNDGNVNNNNVNNTNNGVRPDLPDKSIFVRVFHSLCALEVWHQAKEVISRY